LRDIGELVSAAYQEHEKTVIILAGCIFESVLYCFIQLQTDFIAVRRGLAFAFNPEDSLNNYVGVFNRYFSDLGEIPDLVVEYRNIVHLNRELNYPPEVCQTAALNMLALLDVLLQSLSKYSRI
jgi:hypothetical protein